MNDRPIIFLALMMALCVSCAHADSSSKREAKKPEQGEEQASESIEDVLSVDLDELDDELESGERSSEQLSELDAHFWESGDGISDDAVFGPRESEATDEPAPGQPAQQAVRRAHTRARAEGLTAAILAAPPERVEQILAWRRQLRDLRPGAQHARHSWGIHTIKSGVEAAVEKRNWTRVVELQVLYERHVDALVDSGLAGRSPLNRSINQATRWLQPAFAAAHFHLGQPDRASDVIAQALRDVTRPEFLVALGVAERLHELDADELSRAIVAGPLVDALDSAPDFNRSMLASGFHQRAIKLVGRIGADDQTRREWAQRFLRVQARAGSRFAVAISLCREALGDRFCTEVEPQDEVADDLRASILLACEFYKYRRDNDGLEAAREGFQRFVDGCDAACREALERVAFRGAMCSPINASVETVPGVAEVLVSIPLQSGDMAQVISFLDAEAAHPYSKALVALTIRPANLLLRDPAQRVALVEAAMRWLDAAEARLEQSAESFPSAGEPWDAIAELRIGAADMLVDAGLAERARKILADVRVDTTTAPRLLVRAAEMLVGMGEAGTAADLLIEHITEEHRRELQQWVAPAAHDLPARHALRVYRAAATAHYSRMAEDGLARAISEDDVRTARFIIAAFEDDVEPLRLLGTGGESALARAAEEDPRWARFYLELLRSRAPEYRTRQMRIRIARVAGQAREADAALAEWAAIYEGDDNPCTVLGITLREGPGADKVAAMIRVDAPEEGATAKRLMASLMLHMQMRRADGDPLRLEARYRSRVTTLTRQIISKSPMVCASPIRFADIMAGGGFPEAALAILDEARAQGFHKDRNGIPFEPIRQRYLEMRVALDIDDVERAARAIERVDRRDASFRRALQRELGWYLLGVGREPLAAEYFDKSLFSLERLVVEEAVRRTSYDPLRRWRAQRASIERVDDTVVALARIRVDQGRGADFAKKLDDLQSRSTLDNVRKRRLALRLLPLFEYWSERAEILEALDATGMNDRLWMIGARAEIVDGQIDRGFAKFDIRASRLAGRYGFWLDQAYWLIDRGQIDVARRAMERARRVGGDGPGLAVARGRIALLGGDDTEAINEFREALLQLHLRTTVEYPVRDALDQAMRGDLIDRLESEGLLAASAEEGAAAADPVLRLKTLDAALRDGLPAQALRAFVDVEDLLASQGQLAVRARAVAELIDETGYPHETAFQRVVIDHDLSQAALLLAEDVDLHGDPTKSSETFRLWAFLISGVERRGLELALEMLDPVSAEFDPDAVLRLVGAHGRRAELESAARSALDQRGLLAGPAPYLLDARLVGGSLDAALSQFGRTAAFVEAHRDVLTSAELSRWAIMQSLLARRGFGAEAAAILGRPPADAAAWSGRDKREREPELDVPDDTARASEGLPDLDTLSQRDLNGLADGLSRAAAPLAADVVADPLLAKRLDSAPGHIPARIAWIVTLFEAGEMERARAHTRAFTGSYARDARAIELLVSRLGERGLWVELVRVVAPELTDAERTAHTELWIRRARGHLGDVGSTGDDGDRVTERALEQPKRQAALRALGRPLATESPNVTVDAFMASVMSAGDGGRVDSAAVLEAMRELGPLEQWCYAPRTLEVVVQLARVQSAPELEALEECTGGMAPQSASAKSSMRPREAAYREGVRRGILSPEDYHDYRIYRWLSP